MKYNSKQQKIAMPEYGRNIQNMVNHCLTLEDRAERQWCAESIIRIMAKLAPDHRLAQDGEKALWDHLAIMSGFQLDIDYPYEVVTPTSLYSKPETIPYPDNDIIYRHYGHIIQGLIQKAIELPLGEERDALAISIAKQMKTNYLEWNKNTVDDYQIFKDLFELSNGNLVYSEARYKLDLPASSASKQTKQKNKKRK
ncbi:DUF4290 domain-containing protein [Porphyromonas endodontalis]|uniref:DUF4290 domain-containing protein n=1 Tax=Porphyromonas endodontalis (strain ATCC 35406 / DSM 24491 / JCM 8526 / CCUG 16442 / BCRC 14492 / NCTC 13058 / HG 370) TaxID=553175 RepID=C3JCC4_POREA|nr:DUF4290 domain-containing protein [Porphyromonas endodontalis]EEN82151.1 hypothetical protein POREN0001_2015 [Porphyromonas endodontalis ATCC 35406]UBH64345.1 DUF4290 domain-containing protein [Porphyromonas endodontalis]SUB67365.1 Uncharacterised protein [Porphyromonas endodontalis]